MVGDAVNVENGRSLPVWDWECLRSTVLHLNYSTYYGHCCIWLQPMA